MNIDLTVRLSLSLLMDFAVLCLDILATPFFILSANTIMEV